MSNSKSQSRDSTQVAPDTTAVAQGSLARPPHKFCQFLKKAKDGVTKKIFAEIIHKRSKNLRSSEPILPNVDHTGALSTPNIKHENASSDVKQGGDPQSALRDAKKTVKGMNLVSGPVESGASATQNAPGDLEDAYSFQDAYLQPLRIFDNIIGKLADVHPYAKIALGVLSCASKMVIAQLDRDQAVHHLVDKLDQVYDFMIQDETLGQISSMRDILGQISQQTLECARFIRDYAETKSFFSYNYNREETRERHSHRNKQ
ncbi:uncharacterized protein F5147DRAFT_658845 [Suillus discolor]|uniref:Uncharacterized protein n=1 Tax=Suillus discolor TaxID=1912936 RepID=A0A9P7ESM9_9AGAM|nr:uncharacterized protein F5147DRAFT_658845 [Suillus discolor]KAG2087913.1 hypothetical protein F5147DRAFT_658845 [Suillus discolor]